MDCQNHRDWIGMADVWETLVSDKSIVKCVERLHHWRFPQVFEEPPFPCSPPSNMQRRCSFLSLPSHVLIARDATTLCPSSLSPSLQHVKAVAAVGGDGEEETGRCFLFAEFI